VSSFGERERNRETERQREGERDVNMIAVRLK
jgi:hypothetical protein